MSKDKVLKLLKSIFFFVLFYNTNLFAYILIYLFKINRNGVANSDRMNVLLSTFTSLVFFIILLIFYWKDIVIEFKKFKDKLLDNLNVGLSCWTLGLGIMIVANSILAFVLNSGGANNENAVQSLIKVFPLVMGLQVCILAPFNEEFVFRKTIYDVVKDRKIFVFLSFLLFGLAHVVSSATTFTDWLYIIPYGALGGAFAYAYSKTDTVFTSICFHVFHNTLLFLLSVIIL